MGLNYIAIVVLTIAAFIFGMIWYSPILFGKPWLRLMRKKKTTMKMSAGTMIMGLINTFIMMWVLSFFITLIAQTNFTSGAVIGILLWLGFAATATFSSVLWAKKPFALWVIDNGFKLIVLLVAGGVFAIWV
jgi:hypothetical protein